MLDTIKYVREYTISNSDVDSNLSISLSALSHYTLKTRTSLLQEICSLSMSDMDKLGFNVIILQEFIEYKQNIVLGDVIQIYTEVIKASSNHLRWVIRHNILNKKTGGLSLVLSIEGVWIDSQLKRVIEPPIQVEPFLVALRTSDFSTFGLKETLKVTI